MTRPLSSSIGSTIPSLFRCKTTDSFVPPGPFSLSDCVFLSNPSLLNVNIAVLLLLAFFETPSSISFTSDITMPEDQRTRFQFPCTFLETIDLTCLLLFAIDALVKVSDRISLSPTALTLALSSTLSLTRSSPSPSPLCPSRAI